MVGLYLYANNLLMALTKRNNATKMLEVLVFLITPRREIACQTSECATKMVKSYRWLLTLVLFRECMPEVYIPETVPGFPLFLHFFKGLSPADSFENVYFAMQ